MTQIRPSPNPSRSYGRGRFRSSPVPTGEVGRGLVRKSYAIKSILTVRRGAVPKDALCVEL